MGGVARIALAVAAACALGCRTSAAEPYAKMHAAACAGDEARFFSYVSERDVMENGIARALQQQQAARPFGAEVLRPLAQHMLEELRQDVKSGAQGNVCGWTLEGTTATIRGRRVDVASRLGNKKSLYFEKLEGRWMLTDYEAIHSGFGSIR
jgi:hypothetical protein